MEKYNNQIKLVLNTKMVSYIKVLLKMEFLMEKDLLQINQVNLKSAYFKKEN